jgi:hypothetical protein
MMTGTVTGPRARNMYRQGDLRRALPGLCDANAWWYPALHSRIEFIRQMYERLSKTSAQANRNLVHEHEQPSSNPLGSAFLAPDNPVLALP